MRNLENLPTTDAGNIKKRHAMRWLEGLTDHDDAALKETVVPKPQGFTGSKFATDVSSVRVTGTPAFIEAVASRLKPFLDFEDHRTRVAINLQQVEDNDTGDLTDNYALYLSVAEKA